MLPRRLPAVLLLAVAVMSTPQYEFSTAPFPELTCFKCDDASRGCQAEHVDTEVCQRGTTSCMVELFFTPNATKMFNFRAGCSTRHSCPEGYTQLMCTDFLNGVKTCRLCCFENNCIDPTPGSKVRVSVMKDLLLNSGFRGESIEAYLAHENEIAFNRGVTPTTTATPATLAPSTTSFSESTTAFPVEEATEEYPYDWTAEEVEEEGAADFPSLEMMRNEADENKAEEAQEEKEEEGKVQQQRVEHLNSPADYSEGRTKKTRERLIDSQEMQMNDQTLNEESATKVGGTALWDSSRGAAVHGGVSIASALLVAFVAAVQAAGAAV